MKPTKILLSFVLTLFLSVFLFSCGNNLSRSKAEKLIKQKFQLPNNEIYGFSVKEVILYENQWKNMYDALQNEGLIKYNEEDCYYNRGYHAYFTEKGKQYVVGEEYPDENYNECIRRIKVVGAKLEFGEIKGIVERKEFNVAEVSYTLIRKEITPFGKIAFNLGEETITKTVNFTKYDDGWRIDEKK